MIFFIFGLSVSCWAPLVPLAKMRLGVDDGQLGLILLVFGIGALSTLPLTGWLVNRYGSRLITLWSSLILLAILPYLTVVNTIFLLSAALFVFGFTSSALNIAINSQAVSVETLGARPLMSSFHCLFSTGGLAGALLMGLFLEAELSLWLSTACLASLMAALVGLQWKYLLNDFPAKKAPSPSKPLAFDPRLFVLGIMCFISFMAEGSMLDWSAEFLRTSLHYEPALAGIGYSLFSVSMAVGRLFGDRMIQKWGILHTLRLGSFLSAAGFLVANYFRWGHAQLVGFCLIGLGSSNIVPILFSTSGKIGSSSGQALTLVTSIGYIGMLIGPALIGFIAQMTNLAFAFTGIACLLAMVGLLSRFVSDTSTAPELSKIS